MSLLTFKYRGTDRTGQQVSGQVEALDEHQAWVQVRELGLAKVIVSRVPQKTEKPPWVRDMARRLRHYFSFALYRVGYRELAIWARSASFTFKAGMNAFQAWTTIAQSTSNPTLCRASEALAQRALRGETLAPAMAEFPWAFPPFVRAMVAVGEEAGTLEQTFTRLADFFEHMHEVVLLQKKSTFYTKLLIVAALLIIPFPAFVLQGAAAYFTAILGMVLPAVVILGGGWLLLRALGQIDPARTWWGRVKIRLPKIGQIYYRQSLANWSNALSMLHEAGVPLHRAVVSSAGALGNPALEKDLLAAADGLLEGKPFTQVLRESGAFPQEFLDILAVADSTGNTSAALERVAAYYEQESRVGQKQLVTGLAVAFYLLVAAALGVYIIGFWAGHFADLGKAIRGF